MGKIDEIIKLLDDGKTIKEILKLGYKQGTFYTAQRKWKQGKVKSNPGGKKPNDSSTPINQTSSTDNDIESDPEIVKLKKEIRKAELEKQLGLTKTPLDLVVLTKAAQDLGMERFKRCSHADEDICTFWNWTTAEEIPIGIGEPISVGKDGWRIRPSPLYCVMCVENLNTWAEDLENIISDNLLHNIQNRFKCECGTEGTVAVFIKCTACGKEKWWSRPPKNN